MSVHELDSVEIKCPELIQVLETMKTIPLNKSIFIIGEDGTGRSVLAENILKTLASRGGKYTFKKNVQQYQEISSPVVFTMMSNDWKIFLPHLNLDSYFLIRMPTLSERKMDLPALSRFTINVLGLMYEKSQVSLTAKAIEKILQYNWPGQYAELESVLEKAVSQNTTGFIEPEEIQLEQFATELDMPIGLKLEELERKYILQTLYFVHQNRTKAADILGISIRTLRNKINQYRQEGYL